MSSVHSLPIQSPPSPLPFLRIHTATSPDSSLSLKPFPPSSAAGSIPRTVPSPIDPRRPRSFAFDTRKLLQSPRFKLSVKKPSAIPPHVIKEIKQSKEVKKPSIEPSSEPKQVDQDAEMSTRSATVDSVSSSRSSGSRSPTKKSRSAPKDVDWTEVTDPEERRRIQNRIAQRKFREKARENKEKAEREARNQENAGNSYRIPSSDDFMNDTELSGLPWGSVNIGLVVTRGHDSQGRRSSGRGTYVGDDGLPSAGAFGGVAYQGFPQTASYGSSGGEEMYVDEPAYTYSPVLQAYPSS